MKQQRILSMATIKQLELQGATEDDINNFIVQAVCKKDRIKAADLSNIFTNYLCSKDTQGVEEDKYENN